MVNQAGRTSGTDVPMPGVRARRADQEGVPAACTTLPRARARFGMCALRARVRVCGVGAPTCAAVAWAMLLSSL